MNDSSELNDAQLEAFSGGMSHCDAVKVIAKSFTVAGFACYELGDDLNGTNLNFQAIDLVNGACGK